MGLGLASEGEAEGEQSASEPTGMHVTTRVRAAHTVAENSGISLTNWIESNQVVHTYADRRSDIQQS